MSKHTPGPWFETIVPTSAGSAITIQSADHRIAIIYVDGIRKGIDDELPRSIQNRANARLIAAAPDLLAVLKAFSDYVHQEQSATDGAVTYSTTAINHWAFLARAAIAKATGGQA